MTQRVSRDHHEPDDDLDDETGCVNLRLEKDLDAGNNAEKNNFRLVAQEFPVLLPLGL